MIFFEDEAAERARAEELDRLRREAVLSYVTALNGEAAPKTPAPPATFGIPSLGAFIAGGTARVYPKCATRAPRLTPSAVRGAAVYRDHETYSTFSGTL